MEIIEYHFNRANYQELLTHLQHCKDDFIPPLGSRVDLGDYVHKIMSHAFRFEAWSHQELVGLVAAYFNNDTQHSAYITNVSVLKSVLGSGVAFNLMQKCRDGAEAVGIQTIQLEVAHDNLPAINLYQKCGYQVSETKSSTFIMILLLEDGIKNA